MWTYSEKIRKKLFIIVMIKKVLYVKIKIKEIRWERRRKDKNEIKIKIKIKIKMNGAINRETLEGK